MSYLPAQEWKRYCTPETWSRDLGVPIDTLLSRLSGVPFRRGRTQDGGIADCYAEADVRAACADLLPRRAA